VAPRATLLARLPLSDGEPIYAVDVTTWPRCDAETSPERGFYYHPSRHSAGQPIVAGWAFQWIARLSFSPDSWTAPLDAARLRPHDHHNQAAITQVHALVERLPAGCAPPLFVFDAGYDPCQLGLGLGDVEAAILVRLRSGRCFYADPPPAPRSCKGGRPRRRGAKLDCADPTTWPVRPPSMEISTAGVDPGSGFVDPQAERSDDLIRSRTSVRVSCCCGGDVARPGGGRADRGAAGAVRGAARRRPGNRPRAGRRRRTVRSR
jgi:hypothetical protein